MNYYYCVKNCIINKVEAKAGMCLTKEEWNIYLNNPIYDIDLASYYFQIVPTKDSVVTEFWGNGSKQMMEEKNKGYDVNFNNMENKYYTPKIEDLYLGYECEMMKDIDIWELITIDTFRNSLSLSDNSILKDLIRTKFFDIEDIKSFGFVDEGKGHTFTLPYKNISIQLTIIQCNSSICIREICPKIRIFIPSLRHSGSFERELYVGFCPSINEFRTIIKLLNIK